MLQVFTTGWPDDPRKSLIGTGICEKHALKYQKGANWREPPFIGGALAGYGDRTIAVSLKTQSRLGR